MSTDKQVETQNSFDNTKNVGQETNSKQPDRDQNIWAMLCHLSTFSGCIIPFGSIVAPLIIWIVKKDEYDFVDFHGKEALNFQITMLIYLFVSILLMFLIIGFFLIFAVLIFDLIVTIIATVRAYDGKTYRYPLSIRFIR